MIRIEPADEPENFDQQVRQPGNAFLEGLETLERVNFRGREYWRRCLLDLHDAYRSICAYTCHWIPFDTGSDTVEHFLSKSNNPLQAYEWSNFRLICGRLNGRKGTHADVVDPFKVEDGMFAIDFPSLQVIVGPEASAAIRELAGSTIVRLKLNDERCIRMRQKFATEFRDGEINFSYLRRHAPFLASEIDRQGLRDALQDILRS